MLTCFVFHTELLFNDNVWRRVRRMLPLLQRFKICATFFTMAPFHARCRPKNESEWLRRLEYINQNGHEIGLHTHFYDDDSGKKVTLSPERITFLIARDASYFRDKGFEITGFSGGAWMLNKDVYAALIRNGFSHDCTAHSFPIGYLQSSKNHISALNPFIAQSSSGNIIEIPTNGSLSSAAKYFLRNFRLPCPTGIKAKYLLIYLHDYNLLNPLVRLTLFFLALWQVFRKSTFVTSEQLCKILVTEDMRTCQISDIHTARL